MNSTDKSQKSTLIWLLTDDPSERRNLTGYKPMLVHKMKRRFGYWKKKSLPPNNREKVAGAAPRRHHAVWIPGWCDYCVFIFGTDIDLFSSLPQCIVPYCRDKDFRSQDCFYDNSLYGAF